MSTFYLRQPQKQDGYAIHQLISQCPPLDLNSTYTYLLLGEHFSRTCVFAAGEDGQVGGFVSAYVHPDRADTLFVWQVAVQAQARGCGLGLRMIEHLLQRPELNKIRYLETTVGPDNLASRRMFTAVADNAGASLNESAMFERHLFGPEGHDDERLLRIGPLQTSFAIQAHS